MLLAVASAAACCALAATGSLPQAAAGREVLD